MNVIRHKGSPYWYGKFEINGKVYFKSTKSTNKVNARKIAEAHRESVVMRLALGEEVKAIKIKDAFKSYLKTKEGNGSHKRLTGIVKSLLGTKWNKFTNRDEQCFGFDPDRELHTLRTADLEKLVEKRKLEGNAEGSIFHLIVLIRGTIDQHRKLGFLVPMSIEYPTFKKTKAEIVTLTKDEEDRLLKALDVDRVTHGRNGKSAYKQPMREFFQDQKDLVIALLDLGCRTQEVACLEWEHINLEANTIQYRSFKVEKTQTKPMTKRLRTVMERRLETKRPDQKYVFENESKTSHRTYHIDWLKRAVKRAGIEKKIRLHSLRKTYATKLIQNGVSIAEISTNLDHSNITTTQIYAGLAPTKAAQHAADVLDSLER